MIKLVIGGIIAVVAIVISLSIITPVSSGTDSGTEVIDSGNTFSVAIEGEVSKTGTYVLNKNSTMQTLIEAAGGVTSNADTRTYYSDYTISSGSTYFIGSKVDATDICSTKEIKKVNINVDDAATLSTINGFTTSIAESVVSYRETNGSFRSIEMLMNVYGIGNATYRKVRNYVYLHL